MGQRMLPIIIFPQNVILIDFIVYQLIFMKKVKRRVCIYLIALPSLLLVTLLIQIGRNKNGKTGSLRDVNTTNNKYDIVSKHYNGQSLKQSAAEFLITNMKSHCSIKWGAYQKGILFPIFSLKNYPNLLSAERAMDSLNVSYSINKIVRDENQVSPEMLIKDIDDTFQQWRGEWGKHLEFNEMCEYLLPYRVRNENLEDFRGFLKVKYANLFNEARECPSAYDALLLVNHHLLKEVRWKPQMTLYPGDFTAQEIDSIRIGNCNSLSDYGIKVFRALGIPIVNDFVIGWGDYDSGHSWTTAILEHREIPFVACDVQPGEFEFLVQACKNIQENICREEFLI